MSKSKSKTPAYSDRHLVIRDLHQSENIRHNIGREQIEAMKSSILAKGLLQNLIAVPGQNAGYDVIAGLTRFTAVAELINDGKLPQDYPISVRVYEDLTSDSADALAIALMENIVRAEMDFIDECVAMARLIKGRKTEEEIAAIFGYRPKTVVERLLIAKLIPEAHTLVRAGSRNLAWARALTIADRTMQKKASATISLQRRVAGQLVRTSENTCCRQPYRPNSLCLILMTIKETLSLTCSKAISSAISRHSGICRTRQSQISSMKSRPRGIVRSW